MKKYLKSNFALLFLAILLSALSALFAVCVQFLKGDVLDYALSSDISATVRYASFLLMFIVLELMTYLAYDMARGRFAVQSMKLVRRDFFRSLIGRNYSSYRRKGGFGKPVLFNAPAVRRNRNQNAARHDILIHTRL